MRTRIFTAGIVVRRGKMLLLKRREEDDTYPGVWDCVGGHFEKGESAEECIMREAREESGLEPRIVEIGSLIEYSDQYGRSIAVPFLLESESGSVALSEHSEYRWVAPREANRYRIVPDLEEALKIFGLGGHRGRSLAR